MKQSGLWRFLANTGNTVPATTTIEAPSLGEL